MFKHFTDRPPIICFRVSPGTKNDFLPLQNHLFMNTILTVSRKGYPNHNNHAINPSGAFILGYSWGCREALEFSFKNIDEISAVILISPFLIDQNRNLFSSNIYYYLLMFKYLAKAIFYREIKKVLKTISYPQTVSSDYCNNLSLFSNIDVFRQSIFKKNESQLYSYASILCAIDKSNIPIYIVDGEKDIYTDIRVNVSLLKKISPDSFFYEIKNGSHALLWTHTSRISEIIQEIIKANFSFHKTFFSVCHAYQNR